MSSHVVEVSPQQQAKNEKFRDDYKGRERYIKRHSKQAMLTHGITISCCVYLMISGLFVFVPPLTQALSSDVVFFIRMSHRVIGVVFVAVPIISAIKSPQGALHIWKNNVTKWTSDDKKWMILFFPYLFMAKFVHMPDQDEQKSGQRFADGMLWISGFIMGITGVILLLGSTLFTLPAGAHGVILFLHDLFFVLMAIFATAHIFLGSGIFQPYRGMWKVMWKDGLISESDALYHWGHWARKELDSGENVIENPDSRK